MLRLSPSNSILLMGSQDKLCKPFIAQLDLPPRLDAEKPQDKWKGAGWLESRVQAGESDNPGSAQ